MTVEAPPSRLLHRRCVSRHTESSFVRRAPLPAEEMARRARFTFAWPEDDVFQAPRNSKFHAGPPRVVGSVPASMQPFLEVGGRSRCAAFFVTRIASPRCHGADQYLPRLRIGYAALAVADRSAAPGTGASHASRSRRTAGSNSPFASRSRVIRRKRPFEVSRRSQHWRGCNKVARTPSQLPHRVSVRECVSGIDGQTGWSDQRATGVVARA